MFVHVFHVCITDNNLRELIWTQTLNHTDTDWVSGAAVMFSLCDHQAHTLNMFGARYQWITVDGGAGGWRLGWKESGCTASSLQTAADGAIRLQIRRLSNTNTPGVSGRVRESVAV